MSFGKIDLSAVAGYREPTPGIREMELDSFTYEETYGKVVANFYGNENNEKTHFPIKFGFKAYEGGYKTGEKLDFILKNIGHVFHGLSDDITGLNDVFENNSPEDLTKFVEDLNNYLNTFESKMEQVLVQRRRKYQNKAETELTVNMIEFPYVDRLGGNKLKYDEDKHNQKPIISEGDSADTVEAKAVAQEGQNSDNIPL